MDGLKSAKSQIVWEHTEPYHKNLYTYEVTFVIYKDP